MLELEEEQQPRDRLNSNSELSIKSAKSALSKISEKTYESAPFKEELDLDLPNFSSTKYLPLCWRAFHSINYFLFTVLLLASSFCYFNDNIMGYNILKIISHCFFVISTFFEWFYYKRGCLGYSNLNSKVKKNIDKSIKAKILRSEQGWKYFLSFIASCILLYGNIYFFTNENKIEIDFEYINANLIGVAIVSLAQILKLEKILIETKQYKIINDLSNCLVEIFLYFSSLCYGSTFFIQLLYYPDQKKLDILPKVLQIIGSILALLSGIILQHRYYLSDYDDLNTSDLSNVTI